MHEPALGSSQTVESRAALFGTTPSQHGDNARFAGLLSAGEAPFLPLAIASTRAAEVQRAIAPNDGDGSSSRA
jgi:hypothetical protein